ncbi:hypothetical protein QUB29_19475 [Microcoleus sp. B4b_D2]|uniref:hypothetical protein n=1 Tax=Microcoleus sp. B4b_D2 TaxID=3055310 RepID=UPI002FD4A29C
MSDSARRIKSLKTIRGRDIKLRYTQDNLEDVLINQRQYYDNNGAELTPITSLLLARQVATNNPTTDRMKNAEPRYVSACFGSPSNILGESNFKIIIPYAPGDVSQLEQIKEVRTYVSLSDYLFPKSLLSLTYHGENG